MRSGKRSKVRVKMAGLGAPVTTVKPAAACGIPVATRSQGDEQFIVWRFGKSLRANSVVRSYPLRVFSYAFHAAGPL